jgi:hypothetical protein
VAPDDVLPGQGRAQAHLARARARRTPQWPPGR